MLSHCLKCRKNTESKNSKVLRIKNGRMFLSQYVVCDSEKLSKNKQLVDY